MPHIHTIPGQHDFTASAFIVRTDGPEPKVLLHMHKKLNRWLHMGGHIELHETPWETVIHEMREESGYDLPQLRLLQPPLALSDLDDAYSAAHPLPFIISTHPYGQDDHFHIDMAYVFTTKDSPKYPLHEGESTTLKLFAKNEIDQLGPEELYPDMRRKLVYIFDHLLQHWQEVDPTQYRLRAKRHL